MTRRLTFILVALAIPALVVLSACGGAAAPTPTTKPAAPAAAPTKPAATPPPAATKPAATAPVKAGDVAAGRVVFEQNCNACHPGGAQGVGPALRGRNLSADRIRTQVRNGGGQMPAFPPSQISDQQLNDLIAYVQSLQ